MSRFDLIFKDIRSEFDVHNRRLKKFETWEPTETAPWIGDVGAHAYRATNLALGGGAWVTPVLFDAEEWDTGTIHAGGVFTIPADGKYLLASTLNYNTFAGIFYLQIWKDANNYIQSIFDGNNGYAGASGIMDFTAAETVQLRVNAALATNIVGSATNHYFSMFQIQRVG